MENTTRQPTPPGTSQDVARATAAAVGLHVRGRLLGVIAVTSLALPSPPFLSATFSSGSRGLLGGRTLTVVTAMLVLGGAFVILRAAISHDECSRRVDGLCRELESSNTRLKEFSFTDDVTGLYNRRFFATRLEDEVSRYSRFNQPLSVVMLDIDGFKAVNDELGHAAGDETLRIVGNVLQTQSRNIDVVCRYGGDEFAVLLVETGKDGALLYAERIRRQIEAAAFGHGRTITVSLGVACLPEDVGAVPGGHRHRLGLGARRGQARGHEPGRGTGRGRRHREGPARRLGPVSAVADRPSVLIVDDERLIRELLGDVFTAGGYQCRLATNGKEAIEAFQAERPALSVTDIRMPVLDGLGFLKQALTLDPDAAVLVLTGVGDVKTAVELMNGGAYDFIQKPVNPEQLLLTAGRALERRQLVVERRQHQELLERRVTEATSELAATVRHLEESYLVTLEALGSAIDTRDVGTHAHSRRVRGYSLAIARAHGVPESQMPDIEHGVLLHDIGKIGIPDAILLKPGAAHAGGVEGDALAP